MAYPDITNIDAGAQHRLCKNRRNGHSPRDLNPVPGAEVGAGSFSGAIYPALHALKRKLLTEFGTDFPNQFRRIYPTAVRAITKMPALMDSHRSGHVSMIEHIPASIRVKCSSTAPLVSGVVVSSVFSAGVYVLSSPPFPTLLWLQSNIVCDRTVRTRPPG